MCRRADVSAQFYGPWSMYNGFRLAYEWALTDRLLFASDWPVTTPKESVAGLRDFNEFAALRYLPAVPEEVFRGDDPSGRPEDSWAGVRVAAPERSWAASRLTDAIPRLRPTFDTIFRPM